MYNGFSYELLVCDSFYENYLYNGFSYELLVCGSELLVCDGFSLELLACCGYFMHIVSMWWFFIHIVSFRIIFSMKGGYVYVWWTCKNVWVLRVCFLKSKSIQAKNAPSPHLFHTTILLSCWSYSNLVIPPIFFIYL